jgi:Ca2+-binding EF-hand superfamily protein
MWCALFGVDVLYLEYDFNFDLQDSSGQLDKNEFRSCLLSLGYKLGSDPVSHSV